MLKLLIGIFILQRFQPLFTNFYAFILKPPSAYIRTRCSYFPWLDPAHNRPPGAPAAPVSADSVPYQQSLHPESLIQPPTHPSPANAHRHHRTEMAKTAIGEFYTFLVLFSDIKESLRVWRCWDAVATPMTQKDADGCWEGAAKLRLTYTKLSYTFQEGFCSPFLPVARNGRFTDSAWF